MSEQRLNADLRAELGDERRLDFLAALPIEAQARLAADLHSARQRQRTALDQAVDHGLRMAPALLRGPLKKILFS